MLTNGGSLKFSTVHFLFHKRRSFDERCIDIVMLVAVIAFRLVCNTLASTLNRSFYVTRPLFASPSLCRARCLQVTRFFGKVFLCLRAALLESDVR